MSPRASVMALWVKALATKPEDWWKERTDSSKVSSDAAYVLSTYVCTISNNK